MLKNLSSRLAQSNAAKGIGSVAAFVLPALLSPSAFALDLTTLTDAVVFTDVITAVLAVAAAIITVHIAIKAIQFVFRVLKTS